MNGLRWAPAWASETFTPAEEPWWPLRDPQRAARIPPEAAAGVESLVPTLMDVMESNRRFRPAGTADVWPYIRRIYELVAKNDG